MPDHETLHFVFDEKDPDLASLRDIARGCRDGKIVAFPTETVYGIGGPMSLPGISQKLVEIKKRQPDKPFAYHIGDWEMLNLLRVERTPAFKSLTGKFWPGPLTLVVRDQGGMTIGLRYPRNRITTSLISTVGEPFVGTSANRSGEPSPKTAKDVLKSLDGDIDYLIDSGPCALGEDSTVVDLTQNPPVVLRRGAEIEAIEKVLESISTGQFSQKHILMLCTGNSCRSPMAEGWLKSELKRKQLDHKISVTSAGVMPASGRTSTPEAVLVMKNREIDISDHKSQTCTREMIMNSDLIIAMSQEHSHFILNMMPEAKPKIMVLDIPDPIGMGLLIYEEVVRSIERKLLDRWNEIVRI